MRHRFLLTLLLIPLFQEAHQLSAQEVQLQPFRQEDDIAPGAAAARAFSTFSKAWSSRDAGRVANFVPADARARVTIESRGVSSQMSRGQIEALLAGLFSGAQRPAFDLSTIHLSDENSAYAVGDWSYESREPFRQRETVFVVFRQPVPGSWVLSELRIRPAR